MKNNRMAKRLYDRGRCKAPHVWAINSAAVSAGWKHLTAHQIIEDFKAMVASAWSVPVPEDI